MRRGNFTWIGLGVAAWIAVACTSTAGVPITLTLELESLSDGAATTPTGWRVELDEAWVLIGPVYAYAPLDEDAMAMARRLLGPPVAHAHGGFDPLTDRLVRAEYLDQVAFDALSNDPLNLGEIDGLLGAVDEASAVLDAPLEDADGPTRGHHLWVAGTATRDDETVRFEGGLDLPEEGLSRRVDAIAVDGPPLAEGSVLRLGVDASAWLAEADFSSLVGAGSDVRTITPDLQPYRAWRLGARSPDSFTGSTEEN